jgi:hypothetical protein
MREAVARARTTENVEFIWPSTREVFHVIETDEIECHIITAAAAALGNSGARNQNGGNVVARGRKSLPRRCSRRSIDITGRGACRRMSGCRAKSLSSTSSKNPREDARRVAD